MSTTIQPASIDSPEFFDKLLEYGEAYCGSDQLAAHAARLGLVAHIDAWTAERANNAINQSIDALGNLHAAELAEARAAGASAWIRADQRLPDDETLVLVALNDGEVCPAFLDGELWRFSDAMPVALQLVTHWMPMPSAPTSFHDAPT